MKKYDTLYYFLFVMLIMGGFAAMAQNDYGITIIGIVAFAFALIFITQIIFQLRKNGAFDSWTISELACLTIISLILALRVFFIRFVFAEVIFGAAGLLLTAVYLKRAVEVFKSTRKKNSWLLVASVDFYLTIALYILSMTIVPFIPSLAEPFGGIAFVLLIVLAGIHFIKRNIMIDGDSTSIFKFVSRFQNRSVVLIALFFVFTLYLGLTKIGWLPKMYSNEFPQSYFELINRAETGREKPVNGKYKHEEFIESYDRFVKRNIDAEKK